MGLSHNFNTTGYKEKRYFTREHKIIFTNGKKLQN